VKKHWLFIGITIMAAVLALGAIACGDGDEDAGDGAAEPTATVEEVAPTEPAADETPEAGAEIAPITLDAMDDSGVTGTATVTQIGTDGTEVIVTIDGGLEPGSHQNHFHHGTCEAQGDVHVTLGELVAADDGSAETTTSFDPATNPDDQPFSHWLAREHYIAAHAIDGTVVTCGNVEAAS
jgi:hypothetical protein